MVKLDIKQMTVWRFAEGQSDADRFATRNFQTQERECAEARVAEMVYSITLTLTLTLTLTRDDLLWNALSQNAFAV